MSIVIYKGVSLVRRVFFSLLLFTLLCAEILYASEIEKKIYDLPTAQITYIISGGGVLSPEVNLTVEGNGTLCFREWGTVALIQKDVVERMEGTIPYRKQIYMMQKRQKRQLFEVDYKNRKIRERPLPRGGKIQRVTEGLEKSGQMQMVGNVVCNMWESPSIRKCIYKGIPVFTEYRIGDFFYREAATDVVFDNNVSGGKECKLPNFPVQKFALMTGHFKTATPKGDTSFSEQIRTLVSHKRKEQLLSDKAFKKHITKPLFTVLKKRLPSLLETMKRTRACLVQVSDTKGANVCLEPMVKLKPYFTQDVNNTIYSWENEAKHTLEMFDTYIAWLQPKMKCIRAAKSFSDLSMCMKP